MVSQPFDPLDPTTFSAKRNSNAIALIIGVESYTRAPKAKFADNDANVFSDYARRALGVPESNIMTLVNEGASLADVKVGLKRWLRGRINSGISDVYVFLQDMALLLPMAKTCTFFPMTALRAFSKRLLFYAMNCSM